MKKVIISIIFCILAANSYAQSDSTRTAKDRLTEIENMELKAKKAKSIQSDNDIFEVNALAHFGYGWLSVNGDNFSSKFGPSREIFLNALNLEFNPAPWVSLEAGLDFKWNKYAVKGECFIINNGDIQYPAGGSAGMDNIKSAIKGFSFTVPALLKINLPYCSIGGGVELIFNRNKYTHVNSTYDINGTRYTARTNGGKLEPFRMAYMAMLDFDGLGVYYKYCPESIIQGSNIIRNYHALGIILTM